MFTNTVLISLLPLLANAYPQNDQKRSQLATRDDLLLTPFELTAVTKGPFNGKPVSANGNGLWIGKPTESICPQEAGTCPPGKTTSFRWDNGALSLNSDVPAGQSVYILPNHALSWNNGHDADVPYQKHYTMNGFLYSDKDAGSTPTASSTSLAGYARPTGTASKETCPPKFTFKDLGKKSWKACPVTETSKGDYGSEPLTAWQLFAWTEGVCDDDVPGKKISECVEVELVGKPDKAADAGAYAYGTTMA